MLIPALGQAAQAAEGDAPLADYLFTQTTGADVADAGGGAPATVLHADDSQWTGSSLELTGGSKNSDGNWVRLPDDLLASADSATITTEVKIDESMKDAYNFLWNIGADGDTDSYFFASVRDAPRTAITTGSNGESAALRRRRASKPTAGTRSPRRSTATRERCRSTSTASLPGGPTPTWCRPRSQTSR